MSPGTLTRPSPKIEGPTGIVPAETKGSERPLAELPVRRDFLVDDVSEPLRYGLEPGGVVSTAFPKLFVEMFANLSDILAETVSPVKDVWDTPKLQALLSAPLGASVEISREEADEIVRLAFGRRPDLATGERFVQETRELLGHSLIERLKSTEEK